jgi:hypothetical protein
MEASGGFKPPTPRGLATVDSDIRLLKISCNYSKFVCGAVPYGRATADSANAAQVDRVNVAKGFRQTQKLQVVKFTERSEVPYRDQTSITCSVRHCRPACQFQCR